MERCSESSYRDWMDKYDMPGIALYQCERHVLDRDLEAKFSLALDEGEAYAELLKCRHRWSILHGA
eukprot:scaffold15406_cov119-Isochrysis_galbana.AAC.3